MASGAWTDHEVLTGCSCLSVFLFFPSTASGLQRAPDGPARHLLYHAGAQA